MPVFGRDHSRTSTTSPPRSTSFDRRGLGLRGLPGVCADQLTVTTDASPWRRYVLVLVDFQYDFWSEPVAANAPELPNRVAALLAYARAEGMTVVHARARFRPDGRDWMARYRLRNRIPCVDGTPGVETLPFAAEVPGEPVVIKQTFDGFLGTELDEVLTRRSIRGVLVAGLVTSTCVLFTAATATQRGYLVSVVTDCCSDREGGARHDPGHVPVRVRRRALRSDPRTTSRLGCRHRADGNTPEPAHVA